MDRGVLAVAPLMAMEARTADVGLLIAPCIAAIGALAGSLGRRMLRRPYG